MATEIELKAWVSDPLELKEKLSSLAVLKGFFERNDAFFVTENSERLSKNSSYGVRLRQAVSTDINGRSEQRNLVTCKTKDIRDGIEVNEEREFEVSSSPAFEEFLMNLGFKEKIRKRKIGSTYDYEGITAELTEVEGLGWFIELEILLPERDNEKIENVRERLLCLLDLLEVSRSKIESRSYSSMLAEIRSDSTILADY